ARSALRSCGSTPTLAVSSACIWEIRENLRHRPGNGSSAAVAVSTNLSASSFRSILSLASAQRMASVKALIWTQDFAQPACVGAHLLTASAGPARVHHLYCLPLYLRPRSNGLSQSC